MSKNIFIDGEPIKFYQPDSYLPRDLLFHSHEPVGLSHRLGGSTEAVAAPGVCSGQWCCQRCGFNWCGCATLAIFSPFFAMLGPTKSHLVWDSAIILMEKRRQMISPLVMPCCIDVRCTTASVGDVPCTPSTFQCFCLERNSWLKLTHQMSPNHGLYNKLYQVGILCDTFCPFHLGPVLCHKGELKREGRSFTLIFRTFGSDLPKLEKEHWLHKQKFTKGILKLVVQL